MISMLIGWFSMKLPLKIFFGFVAVNLFLIIRYYLPYCPDNAWA